MKTTLISNENNKAKFTMEFSAEEFENSIIEVYKRSKDNFQIDGFRKGKVPRSIIEKHYGEGIFFEDAVNDLLQTAYPEAINELDIEVIASPQLDFSEIKKGEGFTVTADVELYPVVEVKDYMGVEIEEVIPEIKAEEVDMEVENMRQRNARIEVADRAAKEGDTVILDYAGFVGEEQFAGGTAENQELKLGSNMFIPGFEEQLVGVSADEDKDVTVTFPEGYQAEELAGKEAVFHCHVHEVKEEILPELDDEFAKDVSEFDTLEELKKDVEENMLKIAGEQAEAGAKDMVVAKVYENNEVQVPTVMIEDEIDRMIQQVGQEMAYQGLTVDQYLQFMGKTMKDLREEMRDDCRKQVTSRVIIRSIIDKEGVEVAEEEIDKELQGVGEAYGMDAAKVKEMIGEENMKYFANDIAMKKAIDMLYDNAKITKISREEAEKRKAEAMAAEQKAMRDASKSVEEEKEGEEA